MKVRNLLLVGLSLLLSKSLVAQDSWEPRTHFTGYINSVAEYSDQKKLEKKYAVGLSELGFLASYLPLEKLEFKSTLVYSHYTFDVSQVFVEGYGMYHFDQAFKLAVGRFLTPLSPVNLYFYAPLNPSGVVPMLVSHHFMFPQSISGFQILGEYDANSKLKLGYNASVGSYAYINHFEAGVLGIQSQEDSYATFGHYATEDDKINNYLCGTGRVYAVFNDQITVGANYFTGDAQQFASHLGVDSYFSSTKYTYGFDLHMNISNIKVNGEYWAGKQKTTSKSNDILGYQIESDYEGYYGEVIYDGDVFKPFVRYDFINDVSWKSISLPTEAATVGLAFRPRFETLVKLEYKRIMGREIDKVNVVYKDHDYNYAQLSFVLSF